MQTVDICGQQTAGGMYGSVQPCQYLAQCTSKPMAQQDTSNEETIEVASILTVPHLLNLVKKVLHKK